MADTSASLAADAEMLGSLKVALTSHAEIIGAIQSGSAADVAAMADHWGGPRAIDVLTAAGAYADAVASAAGALDAASGVVERWSTAASSASEDMAIWEQRRSSASEQMADDMMSETAVDDFNTAANRIAEIRAAWQVTCTSKVAALESAITTLFTASTTVITADDESVLYDNSYFAVLAQLAVQAELDLDLVDPTGQLQDAINARAALLGSEDGALLFAVIETSNQADIGEADGNFSEDDILAACDPATVEALLRQAAAENGHEWSEGELDAFVAEIVGTAWMMRASPDEAWEDIDDDIEWYEHGPVNWARENLLAPLASVTVGALCYSAAVGGSAATGGVSLGAAGYCGGLAAATYNATNTWAHGGDAGDVVDSFTDPQAWAIGAAEGVVFQGATNFLLRAPAPAGAASGVDDALAGAVDDLPVAPATPSGNQYSVAYETQLDPGDVATSRRVHRNRANAAFDTALSADSSFAAAIDDLMPAAHESVSAVGGRATPTGWTWHHVPSSAADGRIGVMQLVPIEQHSPGSIFQSALHPNGQGGYSEWAIPAGAPPN